MGLKLQMKLLEFSKLIVLFALSLYYSATDFITWMTVLLEVFTVCQFRKRHLLPLKESM